MNQEFVKIASHTSYLELGGNDRPNIGFIRGEKGSIVWDGGNSCNNAQQLLSKLTAEEAASIRLLVLSHKHWDHVFGAQYFQVPVMANAVLKKQLDSMRGQDWTREGVLRRAKNKELCEFGKNNYLNEFVIGNRFSIPEPDYVTYGKAEINLGGVTCSYEPVETCHAEGCSVLYVKEDKVLFLGDCLWPNMEGMEEDWYYSLPKVAALKKYLESFDAMYYIDSHEVPIPREKLFLWMDKLIFILQAVKSCRGDITGACRDIPEQLKGIVLCYEDSIMTACRNCR